MNGDEIEASPIAARGNNESILNIMHVFLVYKALYGEEKFKNFLEAVAKDMKKNGLNLKDYIKLEEPIRGGKIMENKIKCARCGNMFDGHSLKICDGDNGSVYRFINLCEDCSDELDFWLDNQLIHVCDTNKNKKCGKESCCIHGGPCQMTTQPEYAGHKGNNEKHD